ncbi:MAG TPA: TnsA endonuclease N-terminal domain-containing protein [Candidatus Baltobacteraceae bacterium]
MRAFVPTRTSGLVIVESKLERDVTVWLDSLSWVKSVAAQPLELGYEGPGGDWHRGYPDFLIEFHDAPPVLCDVMYRSGLRERWPKYKARLRAALAAARSRGWRYCILTDREIHTPYLGNVKFLSRYLNREVPHEDRVAIYAGLNGAAAMINTIIASFPADARPRILQSLWALLAQGELSVNLQIDLTMQTLIERTTHNAQFVPNRQGRRSFLQQPPLSR